MSRSTPQILDLASRLITHETLGNNSSEGKRPLAFQVGDTLRPRLATLMGNGGFRALLSRALVLAKGEVLWLRTVQVNADGALEGMEALRGKLDSAEFRKGQVVLMAQLIGLMVAFIGPNLTLHLVSDIWPQISVGNLELSNGSKNEKTK
jgi:hypothetical protein